MFSSHCLAVLTNDVESGACPLRPPPLDVQFAGVVAGVLRLQVLHSEVRHAVLEVELSTGPKHFIGEVLARRIGTHVHAEERKGGCEWLGGGERERKRVKVVMSGVLRGDLTGSDEKGKQKVDEGIRRGRWGGGGYRWAKERWSQA